MEPVLKRRLLIGIIIVALIIIFLPIPFGHFKLKKQQNDVQNIPPAPSQNPAQSIPPSVDPITATVTPANSSGSGFTPSQDQQAGDPMAQTGNNPSAGSTTTVVNSNATIPATSNTTVTMPAASQINNVSNSTVPATSAATATTPVTAPNIAPAQPTSMTAPAASPSSGINSATSQASAKMASPTATNTAPTVSDAAGNGKLSNMQPQSSLPDTDGSNTAPLAGDDINLPPTPQIIDESQPSSGSSTSVNTDNMNLPVKNKPASSVAHAHASKPYHVRSDDVSSNNVTSKSSKHTKVNVSKVKENEHAQHHQVAKPAKSPAKVTHQSSAEKTTTHMTKETVHSAGNWVVQAASFPEKSETQQVVNKLKAQGLHAFVGEAEVSGKTVYRAYVGPFVSREQANEKVAIINKKLHTNAYVHEISK